MSEQHVYKLQLKSRMWMWVRNMMLLEPSVIVLFRCWLTSSSQLTVCESRTTLSRSILVDWGWGEAWSAAHLANISITSHR